MCGILFARSDQINLSQFAAALSDIQHRGPDSSGNIVQFGNNFLGHNRLSILDLDKRSNQPFFSKDKRFVIIYNGEIYNYRELIKEYDISVNTTSDTELVLELYMKLGPRCLERLNGMFAFVIYNSSTNDVFVARDRLGVKPLYQYKKKGTMIFSSEISPVLRLIGGSKVDEVGLRQYRKLRTFFNGRTIYSDISMFPAGHYYERDRLYKYWELPQRTHAPAPTDEELRSLIESAIKYRLVSDVPIGSYLSGGLDSTIVAGLSKTEHTWTIGAESNNEFHYARLAAKKFNTNHHEILYDNEKFIGAAEYMIKKRKEPLSVPNEVLLYLMTREVKTLNTVILSGEGADELFFGYDRIFRWAAAISHLSIKEFDALYSYGSTDDIEIVEDAIAPFKSYGRPIDVVAAFFQVAHLHGLLRRLDYSTMLCSVEARVPFVDYRLVERMAGVDFEYRMKGGIVKEPLKRIFGYLVPREVIERKKVGFPVNLSEVLPDTIPGKTQMDKWFNFNLLTLGIHTGEQSI